MFLSIIFILKKKNYQHIAPQQLLQWHTYYIYQALYYQHNSEDSKEGILVEYFNNICAFFTLTRLNFLDRMLNMKLFPTWTFC